MDSRGTWLVFTSQSWVLVEELLAILPSCGGGPLTTQDPEDPTLNQDLILHPCFLSPGQSLVISRAAFCV